MLLPRSYIRCCCLLLGLITVCMIPLNDAEAQPAGYIYDEAKVPEYTLPHPFAFLNGNQVETADDWNRHRRPELLRLFEEHEYGAMPPAKPIERVVEHAVEADWLDGKATRTEFTLYLSDDDSIPGINVLILAPVKAENADPAPAFMGYNFNGNHTVHSSPDIRLSNVWERKVGSKPKLADESKRGASASRWPAETMIDRGYALVTIYYGDVDPDFHDGFKNGVHPLYPEYQNRDDNWTSIGAWAWGLSRVMDYLETKELVDAQRVAVFGHSRLGKTSLWAGATDERFAMVISNDSGCGGAALARRQFGETVARINSSFPHWFCKTHKKYSNNEAAMPVDQHELIALIAPRPVYVASAQGDKWADPHGEFLSCVGADVVYRLLGTEGLPTKEWPEVNTPVHGQIGYHMRTGKHDVTSYDWQQYLKFADKHLSNDQ